MSFVSILKTIGSAILGVEHIAAPIAEIALPQFAPIIAKVDGIFGRLQNAITTIETQRPTDHGQVKADAVKADFEAGLAVALDALNLAGKKVAYDDAALQRAIDSQVAAYNAMAAVKASFKVV